MKLCTIIFGVLVACVASLAAENGPLLTILQPEDQQVQQVQEVMLVDPQGVRQKRSLLLGK